MKLEDFANELNQTLKENADLKEKINRYEIYIKKLAFDNGGILKIIPFENNNQRQKLKDEYALALGISSIELIKK